MAMNKRKKTTAIVAGVTAAALLLGGTFAWTSISQQAKNEAIVDINPGGRLHDDFDGKNKDVYVENFSSGATGVNIFARIRLDQYFEVGQDAGINKEANDRKADVKIGGNINDVNSWETYKPVADEDGNIDMSNPLQANDNWQWTLGNNEDNKPYYMPTFNKNKDSLVADINGTYEGTVEGDIVHYDDFVKYGSADDAAADSNIVNILEGTEVYDWDEDTIEQDGVNIAWDKGNGITYNENDPIDSANVYHKTTDEDGNTLTHTAQQIDYTATIYTMAQWIEQGSPVGPYWVYDTDGWAYWAQPIKPGETTGLLLDEINMSRVPDDNWYYGINVVGQFATAGDLSAFDKDGISDDALDLLSKAAELNDEWVIEGPASVAAGESVDFTATLMRAGVAVDEQPDITWEIGANTTADSYALTWEGNTLIIAETVEPASVIEVVAKTADGTVVGNKTVHVLFTVEAIDPADFDGIIAQGQSVTFKVKGNYTADDLVWTDELEENWGVSNSTSGVENADGTYTISHPSSGICGENPKTYKVYLASNPDVYCLFEVDCEV